MLGLLGDKKKIVSIILAESPKHKNVPQGLEGDFSPAMEAYAKDVIEAVEAKDAKALAMALKELIYACQHEDEYSEDSEQVEG
jgi:aromatic ring-opening dioxygenase LigB subunit